MGSTTAAGAGCRSPSCSMRGSSAYRGIPDLRQAGGDRIHGAAPGDGVRGSASLVLPLSLAAALTATIMATKPGLFAGASLADDFLPVVLQIGVLMLAIFRPPTVLGDLRGSGRLALASRTTACRPPWPS
jgi:hypothetical protein